MTRWVIDAVVLAPISDQSAEVKHHNQAPGTGIDKRFGEDGEFR